MIRVFPQRAVLRALGGMMLVLAFGAGRVDGVEPGAAATRDLTVTSADGNDVALVVRLHQAPYGPEGTVEAEKLRQAPGLPEPGTAGSVVLSYLAAVLRGSPAQDTFYEPGEISPEKAEQAAEIYRKLLSSLPGGVRRLRLERVWLFRNFQVHLVRALSPGGESKLLSVSTKRAGDRTYRSDDWGEWQPVHVLLWYMVRNADRGIERTASELLPVSFTLGAGGEGPSLVVSLEGVRYGAAKSWIPVRPVEAPATPGDFVLNALVVASSGSDADFLGLLQGREREELAEARTRRPEAYAAARRNLAGVREVRHLFTASVGDHRVHYYLDSRRPQEVRTQILVSEGGRLWLSEDLYGNLEIFFTSPLIKKAVYQTFGG